MRTLLPESARTGAVHVRMLCLLWLAGVTGAGAAEFRGIWADAWGKGFLNPAEARQLVEHCRRYNFNAVIVQARRRGDAFYMPQAPNGEPRTTELAPDYDALQEIIRLCHDSEPRIQVHCWVTTFLTWSGPKKPSQAGHVVNLHPEYLMENFAGDKHIGEGMYLDPGHPEALEWIACMARDIVRRYNMDGFHWDYIRYPAQDSGYNPAAVARYNEEFDAVGKPSASDARFCEWRRRQVTDFLRWCNADLYAIKTNLVISCSVFGNRIDAFNARLQDWAAWNREGIIDLCMPMNYTPDKGLFRARVNDAFAHQGIRWVCSGQGAYMCDKEDSLTQFLQIRKTGLSGYALYSYRMPNKEGAARPSTFELLKEKLQPEWTATPELPWRKNPAGGIVRGTVVREGAQTPLYNVNVTLSGPAIRTRRTESKGRFVFYEALPGTCTVSAAVPGMGSVATNITVRAGGISDIVLTIPLHDTIPPVIADLSAGDISDTSALIRWTTDEKADSVVEYCTEGLKQFSTDETFRVQHAIRLDDLLPATTYAVRVHSGDFFSNRSVSREISITTLSAGKLPDIILDTRSARTVGSWISTAFSTDKYGPVYQYKSRGNGQHYVEFIPPVLKTGDYEVYEWHSQGSNRSASTPCHIRHQDGTTTVRVNQQGRGGRWNLLGKFRFTAGEDGRIRITDDTGDGKLAVADAVRLVFSPGAKAEASGGTVSPVAQGPQ